MDWNIELTKKQKAFIDATEDEVFYGGAAGGGKSYAVVIDATIKAINYPGIKLLILRRSFPELERSIIRSFLEVVPKGLYTYNSSKHFVTFKNRSTLEFGYCDDDKAVFKYQSAEFDIIYIDEATHMSEYQVLYLKSRIRGVNDFPKQYKFTSNPGSRSHVFFRERFIEPMPPMQRLTIPPDDPDDPDDLPETRIFIPSNVFENKFLMKSDRQYIKRLKSLPEEERRQLLEGDWYVFNGQFFPEFKRDVHVIEQAPKRSKDWRIYTTMDYGLDALAWYCVAETEKGTAYVLGELYAENVIISDAAKMIKAKLKSLGIAKVDEHLGPSDMWNRRQETGRSVADIFRENGITLRKTSRDRISGWAATKEWLRPYKDEQGVTTAKLKIVQSCVNLIRCLPLLQYDERRYGDAATTPHEITHAPDAIRGFCVYRSRANKEKPQPSEKSAREERVYERFNSNDMFDVYGEKDRNVYDSYNSGDSVSMFM